MDVIHSLKVMSQISVLIHRYMTASSVISDDLIGASDELGVSEDVVGVSQEDSVTQLVPSEVLPFRETSREPFFITSDSFLKVTTLFVFVFALLANLSAKIFSERDGTYFSKASGSSSQQEKYRTIFSCEPKLDKILASSNFFSRPILIY
jgi:hypothetical protein